jgi:hypothetical protein
VTQDKKRRSKEKATPIAVEVLAAASIIARFGHGVGAEADAPQGHRPRRQRVSRRPLITAPSSSLLAIHSIPFDFRQIFLALDSSVLGVV